MNATLDLPVTLTRLTREEITWIAAKSAQTGKSTAEVVKDLVSKVVGKTATTKGAVK